MDSCFIRNSWTFNDKTITVCCQDVSDRIEKESEESEVVKRLEWGGAKIVKGDWKKHITQELQEGLVLYYCKFGNFCEVFIFAKLRIC